MLDRKLEMTACFLRYMTALRIDHEKDFLDFVNRGRVSVVLQQAFEDMLSTYGDMRYLEGVIEGMETTDKSLDECKKLLIIQKEKF